MPAERLQMRKAREIMRLKFGAGLAHKAIGQSRGICGVYGSSIISLYRLRNLRYRRLINAPPPTAANAGMPAASSGAGAGWVPPPIQKIPKKQISLLAVWASASCVPRNITANTSPANATCFVILVAPIRCPTIRPAIRNLVANLDYSVKLC